jgi:hypothetical protein
MTKEDTLMFDLREVAAGRLGYGDTAFHLSLLVRASERIKELERDAARYGWLRTRINWQDVVQSFSTARTAPPMESNYRCWEHRDYRQKRPASEHIDEYIDSQLEQPPTTGAKHGEG